MPQNPTGSNSENKLSVLITGGSGLIGRHLTSAFLDSGYSMVLKGNALSSEKIMNAGYQFFYSNLEAALSNIIND